MAVSFVGYFYDIESLENVFTLVNSKFSDDTPDKVDIDVYYLADDDSKFHLKSQIESINKDILDQRITDAIIAENPYLNHFAVNIQYFNLNELSAKERLAGEFGITTSEDVCADVTSSSTDMFHNKYRIPCDTDNNLTDYPEYYLLGYNSQNYDLTMIAKFFDECQLELLGTFNGFKPITAHDMRVHNNMLFTNQFRGMMPSYLYKNVPNYTAHTIRKNMLRTGRHVDIARLNEKQQHIALKRICGQLGFQIKESENLKNKTTLETVDQFIELIAYNVSDTLVERRLFLHRAYKAKFDLKRALMYEYKDVVYRSNKESGNNAAAEPYKPNISINAVRKDRLIPDSSSAKFSTTILCPYEELEDIPAVSFEFPDAEVAKALNIPRRNILEESKEFFYANFTQQKLRDQFDAIYNMYKEIEGQNYNDSKNAEGNYKYGTPASLKALPSTTTLMPYFDKNGNPTSCFVIFSTGGIHGAEYNVKLYENLKKAKQAEEDAYNDAVAKLNFIKQMFNDDPKAARNYTELDDKGKSRKVTKVTYTDGTELKITDYAKYTKKTDSYAWKEIKPVKPISWIKVDPGKSGPNAKLDPVFAFTSAIRAIHEDFTSYYPKLLMAMAAFVNKFLGEDRYSKIFDNKTLYGKYMKDKNRSAEERNYYKTAREGTKLILNSASGAGDANFESAIKMNNRIISMRIIGQLFSWRIGQAQAIAGARVPSTNTDGLYTADLEESINNTILAQEASTIGVDIEPETMYLITKDSNNRIEYTFKSGAPTLAPDGDLDWSNLASINCSGADVGCSDGPDPTKSLAHPAIIDSVLSRYLIAAASGLIPTVALDKPFDRDYCMRLMQKPIPEIAKAVKDKGADAKPFAELLKFYQNVLAASDASITYPFAYTDKSIIDRSMNMSSADYENLKNNGDIQILQKYNRVFIMRDGTDNCVHIQVAKLAKNNPKTLANREIERKKDPGGIFEYNNALARAVLKDNDVDSDIFDERKTSHDATISKLSLYEPEWSLRINNKDLYELSDAEIIDIVQNLDLDKYVTLIEGKFYKNWYNSYDKVKVTSDDDSDGSDEPN